VVPVAAWVSVTLVLTRHCRSQSDAWRERCAKVLAVILVAYYVVESVVRVTILEMRVTDTLPFEMCSALFFTNAYGLWTRNRVALDMMWFWPLSGPLHAFITPTPHAGFPHLHYFQYFAAHGLLLFTAIYGTVGLRRLPGPGGVRRAFAALVAFVAIVAV